MGDFVHLHLHTEYSLLDGAAKISEIADKAISEGQSAVAITDHGVMYGCVEFYTELKKKGVKPIIGCEVYVAPRSRFQKEGKGDVSGHHLILLCKNEIGYKNLCYMVSMAFIDGFYMKPRIDMELLSEHYEGLICLSGCVGGKIPQLILAGSLDEAEAEALRLKALFSEDFYLEIQNHGIDDERRVAYSLKMMSAKHNIPLVATNDVHYINRSDADIQATLMCIQTNNVITDGRPLGFETDEFYFKSYDEMNALFSAFPGAIENTVKIAEKCNFDFKFDSLYLPDFKPENGMSHRDQLRKDTYDGFKRRADAGYFNFGTNSKEVYLKRIEYELSVIDSMGFNAYFLIVSDFVSYAKRSDIPVGPGRGSGAGSLVAFCIGITDVDPIAFDLLFERFLNPERISMPDFDIDFCYNRREEVIEYVKRKYGADKVAQIVTFGTLAARAVVRDVGRALGMPYNKVDTVAKLIPRELNITIESAMQSPELLELYNSDEEVHQLIDISKKLEGMPRHASTHAAGVVMTEKPTYEYVPLSYSGTGIVTQFDMTTDAKLGLVKFDFLGLRYLTVIKDAENAIKKDFPDFDISRIPFDDKETFELLSEARTDGVFQVESSGMKQVLQRLKPTCLEDIIACIALFRPGPMDSIDKFIKRKNGRETIEYKIPMLSEILDVTYGCIVYQEQVMQICRALANYSYAHADLVRRAMSKKKADAMMAEREQFINGCIDKGITREDAADVFEEMVSFANYAFNKSHATAYAIISYRTAYLKAHYPAQYFAALLTSVLDNATKLKEYTADVSKYGLSVLKPDINLSNAYFSSSGKEIRYGLLAIKNVGLNFVKSVVDERKKRPFSSFDEFVHRMAEKDLNKRTVESLIKCGVFDSLGISRRSLLSSYESIIEREHSINRTNIAGQMDMFSISDIGSSESCASYSYPELPEYSLNELLTFEKECSGMYFSGHMIDNFKNHIESIELDRISDITVDGLSEDDMRIKKYNDKQAVKVAGIITAKKTKVMRNGETMAFIKVEDRYGEIEVIVFSRQYKAFLNNLFVDNAICVEGVLSFEDSDEVRILLSSLFPLISDEDYIKQNKNQHSKVSGADLAQTIYIKLESLSDARINNVTRMSLLNPGRSRIVVYDSKSRSYHALKDVFIDPSSKVIDKLKELFGDENVIVK